MGSIRLVFGARSADSSCSSSSLSSIQLGRRFFRTVPFRAASGDDPIRIDGPRVRVLDFSGDPNAHPGNTIPPGSYALTNQVESASPLDPGFDWAAYETRVHGAPFEVDNVYRRPQINLFDRPIGEQFDMLVWADPHSPEPVFDDLNLPGVTVGFAIMSNVRIFVAILLCFFVLLYISHIRAQWTRLSPLAYPFNDQYESRALKFYRVRPPGS